MRQGHVSGRVGKKFDIEVMRLLGLACYLAADDEADSDRLSEEAAAALGNIERAQYRGREGEPVTLHDLRQILAAVCHLCITRVGGRLPHPAHVAAGLAEMGADVAGLTEPQREALRRVAAGRYRRTVGNRPAGSEMRPADVRLALAGPVRMFARLSALGERREARRAKGDAE